MGTRLPGLLGRDRQLKSAVLKYQATLQPARVPVTLDLNNHAIAAMANRNLIFKPQQSNRAGHDRLPFNLSSFTIVSDTADSTQHEIHLLHIRRQANRHPARQR